MGADKVVEFKIAGDIRMRPRRADYCHHSKTYLDEKTRKVECRLCGQIIEPFDYLWKMATSDSHYYHQRKALKKDCEDLHQAIDVLKKEVHNLKAQKRRANGR